MSHVITFRAAVSSRSFGSIINHIDAGAINSAMAANMLPPDMQSPHCAKLASPNIPAFVLSVVIVLGILVSYLPQHYRIIARRSSEGLSPLFVLLGTTSSSFALFNILCLPTSQRDIACCREVSRFACFSALLGIAQVAVQQACFSFM
jgi:hypothetical protein